MSERLKNTSSVSNENVIEDLTKNLNTALKCEEEPESSRVPDEFVIEPTGFSNGGTVPEASRNYPPDKEFDVDFDKEETEYIEKESKDESDTDSINEESLKDEEVDLTDAQKAERQTNAEAVKNMGNDAFRNGQFEQSIEKYTEGLRICPLQFSEQRAILYCNRSAAKMKLERYEKAAKDCSKAIELDDKYIKAYMRRAQSYENTDKLDESFADYKKVLELDPSNAEAQRAMTRLPPLIEAKNEKLKTEMMGKLKDLGNMFLKPFGLSTENFNLEQDPETKGYKINFKQQ